ncbi:hypothetical protein AB0J43_02080 [Nonomuraea fuscirosea]
MTRGGGPKYGQREFAGYLLAQQLRAMCIDIAYRKRPAPDSLVLARTLAKLAKGSDELAFPATEPGSSSDTVPTAGRLHFKETARSGAALDVGRHQLLARAAVGEPREAKLGPGQ